MNWSETIQDLSIGIILQNEIPNKPTDEEGASFSEKWKWFSFTTKSLRKQ